jgi:hypothetical protein
LKKGRRRKEEENDEEDEEGRAFSIIPKGQRSLASDKAL